MASQDAIKQLGTNGGGFFNANSAHPFENPTGFTNFIEIWSILLIPFALAVTYGVHGRLEEAGPGAVRRDGRDLVGDVGVHDGRRELGQPAADRHRRRPGRRRRSSVGGNLEGKEIRFGPATCGLWAGSTTGTSNGSVNCMHDSFTPLGGLVPMLHMKLGEVSPGGVGVGLMGMLIYALLAVFIAGLMVGRTPEYLGKKIQAAEMKLVVLYLIAMPLASLAFAAAVRGAARRRPRRSSTRAPTA